MMIVRSIVVALSTGTAAALPPDRLELRKRDAARLAVIERAIAPARFFNVPSGPFLCGEILEVRRGEPLRDSIVVVRPRWRTTPAARWVYSERPVELRFADLVTIDHEFENRLDFHLLLSSRDVTSGPLGGEAWCVAMDRALDPSGVLGLGDGESPPRLELVEPGILVPFLTRSEFYGHGDHDRWSHGVYPVRAGATNLLQFTLPLMLDGLVAAEDRKDDTEELWRMTCRSADYLFGLRRVTRRGDAEPLPDDRVDASAGYIERFSLRTIQSVTGAISNARLARPIRADAVVRDALLSAAAAHPPDNQESAIAVADWKRLIDAPSSTIWPDAAVNQVDPSRRASWALRLVRECPSLWAVDDDAAQLGEGAMADITPSVVGRLLMAGSRLLAGDGSPLPSPRLRDALQMGSGAKEAGFLQPDGLLTPIQRDALETLAGYLVDDTPARKSGIRLP